jgi:hypothetical protein
LIEPTSSIIAIAALVYFKPLEILGQERLALLVGKLEELIANIPGVLTREKAQINKKNAEYGLLE